MSPELKRCPTCQAWNPIATTCYNCGYDFPALGAATTVVPRTGIKWLYEWCVAGIVVWSMLCMAGACCGLVSVTQKPRATDPLAQAGHDSGTAIGLGMWAVIRIIPVVELGIMGLLVKPR